MKGMMMAEMPAVRLKVGDVVDGFEVVRITEMAGLRGIAYELVDKGTGARVFHLHTEDAENLFSVTFPTPPTDDTGVPHIMEHSVLGGSQKYRVKDPFFEMVKSSMATFINAMTGADQTYYPVSSNVRQDFYNLAEVYFDAVFHPLLTEYTFGREGHHLELAKKDDPASELIIKGIVYNEMKGAYSSPDSVLWNQVSKHLFPDSPYGKDSGGDPDVIPQLSYEQFRRFHRTYYHPSNAYFFFYGDIPTADHMAFLRPRLKGFERETINPEIKLQPRWEEPKVREEGYPVGEGEEGKEKSYLVMAWIVGSGIEAEEVIAMKALGAMLLGNQGAPLRKALVDSKLGQDLTFSGYWDLALESVFGVGLKGSDPEKRKAFEKLVMETLEQIADEGLGRDRVEAALQQLTYQYLEIQSSFPLHLMDRTLQAWTRGGDPLTFLRANEHLAELRQDYEEDPQMFGRLIRERLLYNPHRLTLVLKPDAGMQGRKDAALAEVLKKRKAGMSQAELKQVMATAAELERLENEPNSPEALATLPQLQVRDLPGKPKHLPTSVEETAGGVKVLRNDVFANGVTYLHVDFNLEGLPSELWEYLPLYADCVRKMGAAGQDYVAMAQRVASYTGGISFSPYVTTKVTADRKLVRGGRFVMKCLDREIEKSLAVLRDFVFEVNPRDMARLADVLKQAKAWHVTNIANHGSAIAGSHASSGMNAGLYMSGLLGAGLPQMRLITKLADEFEKRQDEVVEKLLAIRSFLLNSRRVTASVTGSDASYGVVRKTLAEWAGAMKDEALVEGGVTFVPRGKVRDGLMGPMDVAYCVQMMPAPHESEAVAPLLALGAGFIGKGYILEEVRFKGTAYGGWCSYDGFNDIWAFGSYRDPWIKRTLDVYKGTLEYARKLDWTQTEIDRTIIATAKDGERPIRPEAATGTALGRHLAGITPEIRERRHAALLRATAGEVKKAVLEQLEKNWDKSAVCVVSSKEKLEAANQEMGAEGLRLEEIG